MGLACSRNCPKVEFCGLGCQSQVVTVTDPSSQLIVTTITTTITEDPKKTLADTIDVVEEVIKHVSKTLLPRKHKYNLKLTHNFDIVPDKLLKLPRMATSAIQHVPTVDLRSHFPQPYDQGELGSCTANALCGVISAVDEDRMMGSRLFLYYNERKLENNICEDAGAYLSDGIASLETFGICPETMWPYDISKFTEEPPQTCYVTALDHQALQTKQLHNDIYEMKNALVQGQPFVVGIAIFDSFESDDVSRTGVVPMPNTVQEEMLGGHAVACVGYDDTKHGGVWIMRNSWGDVWGDKGYFYLPYAYLTDSSLSSDLWTIIKME